MEKQELIKQYDRFISQVRTEVKELYWLYNFFFIIEVALIGSIFIGEINEQYLIITQILGLLISLYWLWVLNKQKLWRDNWRDRIIDVENQLEHPKKMHMWKRERKDFNSFIFGKDGLWRLLFGLPIGFTVVWIILIFF